MSSTNPTNTQTTPPSLPPRAATELSELDQLRLKELLEDKAALEVQRDHQLATLNCTVGTLNYVTQKIAKITAPPQPPAPASPSNQK